MRVLHLEIGNDERRRGEGVADGAEMAPANREVKSMISHLRIDLFYGAAQSMLRPHNRAWIDFSIPD